MSSSRKHRTPYQLDYRGSIVYGPVQSRRVGSSLGINLLPLEDKACAFDCVYCQFPRSKHPGHHYIDKLMPPEEMAEVIKKGVLDKTVKGLSFDSITVAGNGDPCIYPHLLRVTRLLRKLITDLKLKCRLSIFTNAAAYAEPDFIEALRLFDQRFIKLDASDEEMNWRINRPYAKVDLDDLAKALAQLDGIIIQTMIVTGRIDNHDSVVDQRYCTLVTRSKAREVQLYTVDKKTAYEGILPATKDDLCKLKEIIEKKLPKTIPVSVYHQEFPSGHFRVSAV